MKEHPLFKSSYNHSISSFVPKMVCVHFLLCNLHCIISIIVCCIVLFSFFYTCLFIVSVTVLPQNQLVKTKMSFDGTYLTQKCQRKACMAQATVGTLPLPPHEMLWPCREVMSFTDPSISCPFPTVLSDCHVSPVFCFCGYVRESQLHLPECAVTIIFKSAVFST